MCTASLISHFIDTKRMVWFGIIFVFKGECFHYLSKELCSIVCIYMARGPMCTNIFNLSFPYLFPIPISLSSSIPILSPISIPLSFPSILSSLFTPPFYHLSYPFPSHLSSHILYILSSSFPWTITACVLTVCA